MSSLFGSVFVWRFICRDCTFYWIWRRLAVVVHVFPTTTYGQHANCGIYKKKYLKNLNQREASLIQVKSPRDFGLYYLSQRLKWLYSFCTPARIINVKLAIIWGSTLLNLVLHKSSRMLDLQYLGGRLAIFEFHHNSLLLLILIVINKRLLHRKYIYISKCFHDSSQY